MNTSVTTDALDSSDVRNPVSRAVIGSVLCMLCILVRGQGLMSLPIFGDEAIYLRWARLIKDGHPWVSLADPKPPLHFWLLSLVIDWSRDPLLAARSLSLFAGVLSIPALMLACDEIGLLIRPPAGDKFPSMPSGRVLGILASVLMIFSPFFSFYQRLATADALFVLEMLIAVWLGLRWGRRVAEGRGWRTVAALGLTMGAAMMTRQGLSYTLWGIPATAILLQITRLNLKKTVRRALLQGTLSIAIAILLWLPFLTADLARFTADAKAEALPSQIVTPWTVIKRRALYQDQFTAGTDSRLTVATRNASNAFLPPLSGHDLTADAPAKGWLFYYLTWPIYITSVAALLWLAIRRQWRVLLLLIIWMALMMGPVIVLGNVVYSRYILAGAMPLLIAAAFILADVLSATLALSAWPALTWSAAGALLIALMILPVRQVGLQATTWWKQTLTVADREQYIDGWDSGAASMKAIDFIKGFAAGGPVVVVTDGVWGLPADALWIYLSPVKNVQVFYSMAMGASPILLQAAAEKNVFMLRKDKWLYTPPEPVRFVAGATVLYVIGNTTADDEPLTHSLLRLNPNLKPVTTFYGIDKSPAHVIVYELK